MIWIYKLRVCLITTTAVILIVLAVAITALRAFLPHATDYVADIQMILSDQIGLPVTIDSIDADMEWFTPRLKLINVVIYQDERELFRFDEAVFALSYVDSLFNLSPIIGEINLIGADLYIERHPDNRWVVQGIEFVGDGSNAPSSEFVTVIQNTNFSLLDSDIHWTDYTRKAKQIDFIGVNLVFESFLGEHSLAVDMLLPEGYGDRLWLVATIDDDFENYKTADWEFYLEGRTINVGKLFSELGLEEVPEVSGTLDGEVWLKIINKKVHRVTADLSVNTLKLKNKIFNQHQWSAGYVATRIDWHQMEEGWRLDIEDLVVVKNKDSWAEFTDVTAINNNESGLRATASYIRPFDLLGLPGVFLASHDLSEMEKLSDMYQGGDLYNIEVHFPAGEGAEPEVSATFVDVDLNLADSGIKLHGADGEYKYKPGHIELNMLSESLAIDFGDLFRQPIYADSLTGELVVRLDDYDWIVESSDVHLLNGDIEAHSRLKVILDKDGQIFVDAQTDFINAKGASVSKYYPVPVMSDSLIEWLDYAITDGVVEKGSFILFGDVGQFPYENNDGVMEVVFSGKNSSLKFFEGWPEIENLNADVRFYNSSLTIENGTGRTYNGIMDQVAVSIPDLDSPVLYVQGNVTAPASDLQKYIWNSGLDDIFGDAMNQLEVSGEMGVKLSLEIPLDDDDIIVKTKGELSFAENELYFPAMGYSLKNISGKLSFTESDMSGSDIVAIFEGVPVNINAYGKGDNLMHETIFHLEGDLPIDGLLKRFDWVPEFWVSGSSDWDILVRIPDEVQEYDVRVEMQSALEGVSINFSDVLSKSREDVLHLEMSVEVMDEVLKIDVDSTDVLNLFATRDDAATWDFVVDSKFLRGSGEFSENLDTDSTVQLKLMHASLFALAYSSDESRPVSLDPATFPSLNVSVKNLKWDDWVFTNVKLETSWSTHGMLINKLFLEGPSLKVSGRGSWLNTWRDEDKTTFNFSMESPDLGNMLSVMGISDSVSGGKAVVTDNWQWPAEPYSFSLGIVKGTSRVEIKDAKVTDLEPGAGGRLLGLFNVFKLGDRLSLDFDDVYKDGFAFDSLVGEFEYDEGDVYTKDVTVKAAAADMKIQGRMGLVERDYDLNMRVKPHTSAAVFTTGALLGGLVTGAAAVLLNKVLGIEKLVRDEYIVTGSWDDPDVELVSKRQQHELTDSQVDEDDDDEF